MRYSVSHSTSYSYDLPIPLSFNEVRLKPKTMAKQKCLVHALTTTPVSITSKELVDFFGNELVFFTIQENHDHLTVTTKSAVDVLPSHLNEDLTNVIWEDVKQHTEDPSTASPEGVLQFLYDSPLVKRTSEIARYAHPSFSAGRPYVDAIRDLTRRIYEDFTYAPNSTTIETPLLEIIKKKQGVCQDFAHVAIGCLRSLGFAARYVSGYLETLPAPGKKKLVGADASHAWFSVFIPQAGWIDFDPTNNLLVSDRHITVAWGRDYGDVPPVNGIYWGNSGQQLTVSVDVQRVKEN